MITRPTSLDLEQSPLQGNNFLSPSFAHRTSASRITLMWKDISILIHSHLERLFIGAFILYGIIDLIFGFIIISNDSGINSWQQLLFQLAASFVNIAVLARGSKQLSEIIKYYLNRCFIRNNTLSQDLAKRSTCHSKLLLLFFELLKLISYAYFMFLCFIVASYRALYHFVCPIIAILPMASMLASFQTAILIHCKSVAELYIESVMYNEGNNKSRNLVISLKEDLRNLCNRYEGTPSAKNKIPLENFLKVIKGSWLINRTQDSLENLLRNIAKSNVENKSVPRECTFLERDYLCSLNVYCKILLFLLVLLTIPIISFAPWIVVFTFAALTDFMTISGLQILKNNMSSIYDLINSQFFIKTSLILTQHYLTVYNILLIATFLYMLGVYLRNYFEIYNNMNKPMVILKLSSLSISVIALLSVKSPNFIPISDVDNDLGLYYKGVLKFSSVYTYTYLYSFALIFNYSYVRSFFEMCCAKRLKPKLIQEADKAIEFFNAMDRAASNINLSNDDFESLPDILTTSGNNLARATESSDIAESAGLINHTSAPSQTLYYSTQSVKDTYLHLQTIECHS